MRVGLDWVDNEGGGWKASSNTGIGEWIIRLSHDKVFLIEATNAKMIEYFPRYVSSFYEASTWCWKREEQLCKESGVDPYRR